MFHFVLPSDFKLKQSCIFALFWLFTLTAWGQKPIVRFLHLNDVYEISPLENGQVGGMARVAGLRKELESKDVPVLTFLVGDFVSPSVIGTLRVDGVRVQGKHMVEVMNQVGIDWVIFGNHEFDIPMSALQSRINEAKFRWMSTNVKEVTAQNTRHFQQNGLDFPETWVYQVDTLKIGFFAVTLNSNQKPWVHYEDVRQSIQRVLPQLKKDCHIVVGLTHLNVADDRKLVAEFPEVSLWMGGHDHEHMIEKTKSQTLAKADANAKTVWIHELRLNTNEAGFHWNSDLLFINPTILTDSATQTLVERWEQRAEASLAESGIEAKEVIFTTNDPLDGRESSVRQFSTLLTDLIGKSMATGYESADLVLLNGGSIRVDDQLIGPITQWDIVRILPFGGSIVAVEMRGSLLKRILTIGQENKGNGGFLHPQILKKRAQPHRIRAQKSYKVVLPSFLLTGQEANMDFLTDKHPDILSIQKPSPGSDNDDIRKVLIRYLKASGTRVH